MARWLIDEFMVVVEMVAGVKRVTHGGLLDFVLRLAFRGEKM